MTSSLISYLIQNAVSSNIDLLLKGPRGSGKSSSIRQAIKTLPSLKIHMIKQTNSKTINRLMEAKLVADKNIEHEEFLIPLEGSQLVVVIDNIALAN